jgi:hypothetical protein
MSWNSTTSYFVIPVAKTLHYFHDICNPTRIPVTLPAMNFLMMTSFSEEHEIGITESLKDLATGHGVKRTRHDLIVDGRDYSDHFIHVLSEVGFVPVTVADAPVKPGERIPAFYINDSVAYFGWVFYEKFTTRKIRKLWGSVIRNRKGDWAIQISPKKDILVYADINRKTEMDLDRPTDW